MVETPAELQLILKPVSSLSQLDRSEVAATLVDEAAGGNAETVAQMLRVGAEKDMTNQDGDTALIRASGAGCIEVVQLLLEAGAAKDWKLGIFCRMLSDCVYCPNAWGHGNCEC